MLYINKLNEEDINKFALSKNIVLNEEELLFTYNFIKKNAGTILKNPSTFDIEKYKDFYSPDTFSKIKKVFNEYLRLYSHYL